MKDKRFGLAVAVALAFTMMMPMNAAATVDRLTSGAVPEQFEISLLDLEGCHAIPYAGVGMWAYDTLGLIRDPPIPSAGYPVAWSGVTYYGMNEKGRCQPIGGQCEIQVADGSHFAGSFFRTNAGDIRSAEGEYKGVVFSGSWYCDNAKAGISGHIALILPLEGSTY